MSPIEKAARAAGQALFNMGKLPKPPGDPWTDGPSILVARAVLEAIRDPSEGMALAGAAEAVPEDLGGAAVDWVPEAWRAMIDAALGTELDSADVWVSKAAHQHIALDHADDYPAAKANIVDIITSPMWVSQDPKHGSNFYLVRRVPQSEADAVLIAIGLELSAHGTYSVRTAYAISEDDILTRRLRGSLHPLYLK